MLPSTTHTELPCLPWLAQAWEKVAPSSFHGSDQRMGHCPPCWMEQQVWQCLQTTWLCRGVPSEPKAGWAQASQAARRCPGEAGQECWHDWPMWASRLARTSSPHTEPGRARFDHVPAHTRDAASLAVLTFSHTTGSLHPPGPGRGAMWPWACSPWTTHNWACVWLWDEQSCDNVGITEGWQRPFCPLHWHLQGEGVPSQGSGSCPPYTWCFHVSLVPWHC